MHAQTLRSHLKSDASGLRAALYLRVSTGRQAEHDLSIPDQRSQTANWVAARGWSLVAEYVEPGASATVEAMLSKLLESEWKGQEVRLRARTKDGLYKVGVLGRGPQTARSGN